MNSTNVTGVVAGPASGGTSYPRRLRRLAVTGIIATLAAMVAGFAHGKVIGKDRSHDGGAAALAAR